MEFRHQHLLSLKLEAKFSGQQQEEAALWVLCMGAEVCWEPSQGTFHLIVQRLGGVRTSSKVSAYIT